MHTVVHVTVRAPNLVGAGPIAVPRCAGGGGSVRRRALLLLRQLGLLLPVPLPALLRDLEHGLEVSHELVGRELSAGHVHQLEDVPVHLHLAVHGLHQDAVHGELPQVVRHANRLRLHHALKPLRQRIHEGAPLHDGFAGDLGQHRGDGHQRLLPDVQLILGQAVDHKDLVHDLAHRVRHVVAVEPLPQVVRVHGLGVDLLAQLLHLLVDEGGRQLGVKVPDEALVDLVELEGLLPQHGAAVRRDL
mmetsp:Transcript_5387/g.13477  ORF Transcript_5387/g.13477 Transcript_5387/m.13477 type:complete len:246 (+) Transcript_5387:709-1446(+)